jgi:hypothetical protein
MQPIGRHHEAYEYTPHRLSDEALTLFDEWLQWFLFDRLDPDGTLHMAREELPTFGEVG